MPTFTINCPLVGPYRLRAKDEDSPAEPVAEVDRLRMALLAQMAIAAVYRAQVEWLKRVRPPRRILKMTLREAREAEEALPARRRAQTADARRVRGTAATRAAAQLVAKARELRRRDADLSCTEIARRLSDQLGRPVSRQRVSRILAAPG